MNWVARSKYYLSSLICILLCNSVAIAQNNDLSNDDLVPDASNAGEYCSNAMGGSNPLLGSLTRVPWQKIKTEHFFPALEVAMTRFRKQFAKILDSKETPNYKNTIEATTVVLEPVDKIVAIFYQYLSNRRDMLSLEDEIKITNLLMDFYTEISSSQKYNEKVVSIYHDHYQKSKDRGAKTETKVETATYREMISLDFERKIPGNPGYLRSDNGTPQNPLVKIERIKEQLKVYKELFSQEFQFYRNALQRKNEVRVFIENESELDGLPVIYKRMVQKDETGKYFGFIPLVNFELKKAILKYCHSKELRAKVNFALHPKATASKYITPEEAGKAWEISTTGNILKIVELRQEIAKTNGMKSTASWGAQHAISESVPNIHKFFDQIIPFISKKANQEYKTALKFAKTIDPSLTRLEASDLEYYTQLYLKDRFGFVEDDLMEYFPAEKTIPKIFDFFGNLFRIKFIPQPGRQSFHPDNTVYKVVSKDNGKVIGTLNFDGYARESREPWAWMQLIQPFGLARGRSRSPIASLTVSIHRAPSGEVTFMTPWQLLCFVHELGHVMHGMLDRQAIRSLGSFSAGTEWTEFPSQVLEYWMLTDEFLDAVGSHYKTGEKIPESWKKNFVELKKATIGIETMEKIRKSLLDLAWHHEGPLPGESVEKFEKRILGRYYEDNGKTISEDLMHIFAYGLAGEFYGYLWSDIKYAADGFQYWYKDRDPGAIQQKSDDYVKAILNDGYSIGGNGQFYNWTGHYASVIPFLKYWGFK